MQRVEILHLCRSVNSLPFPYPMFFYATVIDITLTYTITPQGNIFALNSYKHVKKLKRVRNRLLYLPSCFIISVVTRNISVFLWCQLPLTLKNFL